jgi:hypothetical protein
VFQLPSRRAPGQVQPLGFVLLVGHLGQFARLGVAQLALGHFALDGGQLVQLSAQDLPEPQHGVLLGGIHGLNGGLEGRMGSMGRLAGHEGVHGISPDQW